MSVSVDKLIKRLQKARSDSDRRRVENVPTNVQVGGQAVPPADEDQGEGTPTAERVAPADQSRGDTGQQQEEQSGDRGGAGSEAVPSEMEAVERPGVTIVADSQPQRRQTETEHERVGLSPEPFGSETSDTAEYAWEEKADEEEASSQAEETIDLRYPLIPSDPEEGEDVYAWAHIYYDEDRGKIIYKLNEPELSNRNEKILRSIEDRLKEKVDVDFGEMKREEAKEYLREKIDEVLRGRDFNLDEETREVIQYYAYRNFIGLGKIEPLMNDKYIEDISCDGVGIPVYVYHRNPDIASVETNVVFDDDENLDAFVRKLAQRCGRSVSMAEPLVDGSLPDGSRVQATLATDIARRGSNFTIRRFTEEPLTPVDIMDFGTVNAQILSYLWLAIENGRSILIAGPTASGKTTLLNALSLFIPPDLKIVSIEDTPELRLPHPNWVPEVARSGFGF
ncbi:MAG: type II/IV secretion system ATPase subunit, partial [Candidatus Nanohaloarchaea archaeon]|nr:type II/IV secretion system ATPase subunit [Candidatus Nanohaloarchaea archaeon]